MPTRSDNLYKIYHGFFRVLELAKSAWISLLIIFLVYALTYLAQSDTIFIAMLDSDDPISLTVFYITLFFLINIVSHYPVYIEFKRSASEADPDRQQTNVAWLKSPESWPVGFITYQDHRTKSITDSLFRHALGIMLLGAVFFITVNTYYNSVARVVASGDFDYSGHQIIVWECLVYVLVSICFFIFIPRLADTGFGELMGEKSIFNRKKLKVIFWITTIFFLVSLLVTIVISFTTKWSAATYFAFYISLYWFSFQYSVMRLCRKKVVFLTDVSFVKFLSTGGFLSIIIILFAHAKPLTFNSLVILMAYFIIFYGILIIPVKHYLFYRQYDRKGALYNLRSTLSVFSRYAYYFFSWGTPVLPFLFFGWVIYIDFIRGNELHRLETIPMLATQPNPNPGAVQLNEFNSALKKHFEDKETIYFIALYGGGLKASIWSELVLNELASERYNRILDNTVAISGVSGGGIGAALYTGLRKEPGTKSIETLIEQVSSKNYVAIDLVYLFGHDFLFGLMPQWVLDAFGVDQDRSNRSMQIYANASLDRTDYDGATNFMLTKTYQDYWGELFRQEVGKNKFYPALIMNSAATHTQRGISFSVRTDSAKFNDIFLDATDLLHFDNSNKRSLGFLDATSTTDRFPILSPPAKVEGKGYFLDGGYFENSGLMSLMDFSDYLRREVFPKFGPQWKNKKFVFIQISNDETVFLRQIIDNRVVEKEVKNSQEFASVLEAATSISFVATYLNRKFEALNKSDTLNNYHQVQLPYLLNKNNLNSFYKGTVLDDTITNRIKKSNKKILDQIYEGSPYDYVTPPLGRQMGRQSFLYMKRSLPISGLDAL